MNRVLLIDDEADVRYSFQRIFDSPEIELTTASSGEEALQLIPSMNPDLVLMDVRMKGMTGLETLRRIRQIDSKLLVILMTAYGTTQTAIEAMKLGAYDYLLKPFDVPTLKELVTKALKVARDLRQTERYKFRNPAKDGAPPLEQGELESDSETVGKSDAMRHIFKLVGQFAASEATVLITGESGTGKELVARAIHHHSDHRRNQPFIAVNCAAIPEQLLESELFGHERGAFTGAVAQRLGRFEECRNGVVFLDEIGDMTPATQTKVLRVLQSGEFQRVGGNAPIKSRARIIAATNKRLEQAVAAGQFREDLFYRLNGVRLHMPPLRERNGDIPLLILYFLHKIARQQQPPQPPKSIASSAVKALEKYSWPGNVRELESVMRRAAVISGEVILTKDLPPEITGEADAAAVLSVLDAQAGAVDEISTLARQLFLWARREPKLKVIAAVERELIIHALKETKGNQVHAAKLLGMTRATLRKRLEKFEIQRELSIK